jgi:membrane fusion protein
VSSLFRSAAVEHATRRLAGEVVLAAPIPMRILGALACIVVVAAVGFAATASYARKETVAGWVTPKGGLIRLTARQGGLVEAIGVSEGASVKAGSPIVTLKLSSDLASGDAGRALALSLSSEAGAAKAQASAAYAKLVQQRAALTARRAKLVAELEEVKRRVSLMVSRQSLAEAQVGRGEALAQKGFMAAANLETLRATALVAAQDASQARASALDLERQISDLDGEASAMPADLAAVQAQADQSRASLSQRRVALQTQNQFIATAPVDGRVVALPVERGQSLAPGAAVAVMTPIGSDLIAELYVPSRAAGFIKAGQEVRLMYQAYPYQTFGSGEGRIVSVSRTVLAPAEVAIPGLTVQEPVFRVRVALKRQSVSAYGKALPLQPGMLLSADVVIDRRNLLQWLLDPLYAVGRRA